MSVARSAMADMFFRLAGESGRRRSIMNECAPNRPTCMSHGPAATDRAAGLVVSQRSTAPALVVLRLRRTPLLSERQPAGSRIVVVPAGVLASTRSAPPDLSSAGYHPLSRSKNAAVLSIANRKLLPLLLATKATSTSSPPRTGLPKTNRATCAPGLAGRESRNPADTPDAVALSNRMRGGPPLRWNASVD